MLTGVVIGESSFGLHALRPHSRDVSSIAPGGGLGPSRVAAGSGGTACGSATEEQVTDLAAGGM